ncbi:tristetraprolin-like protein [Lates japonicus]|uniref:Tristetraprolin-like protein n=1 Tax=Lates japonicus TaxID=270547 RepID=A0AAD3NCS6_LATJO|nr:tristetraprolin-like protein [Lates japonicus]
MRSQTTHTSEEMDGDGGEGLSLTQGLFPGRVLLLSSLDPRVCSTRHKTEPAPATPLLVSVGTPLTPPVRPWPSRWRGGDVSSGLSLLTLGRRPPDLSPNFNCRAGWKPLRSSVSHSAPSGFVCGGTRCRLQHGLPARSNPDLSQGGPSLPQSSLGSSEATAAHNAFTFSSQHLSDLLPLGPPPRSLRAARRRDWDNRASDVVVVEPYQH